MKYDDADYPTVTEIIKAANEHVAAVCDGIWPEDDWFDIGPRWSVNVWDELGKRITVYRESVDGDGLSYTDASCGIAIQ